MVNKPYIICETVCAHDGSILKQNDSSKKVLILLQMLYDYRSGNHIILWLKIIKINGQIRRKA